MSGLETRVTNLEEQVGGIRETVAIIQKEQKPTASALGRRSGWKRCGTVRCGG